MYPLTMTLSNKQNYYVFQCNSLYTDKYIKLLIPTDKEHIQIKYDIATIFVVEKELSCTTLYQLKRLIGSNTIFAQKMSLINYGHILYLTQLFGIALYSIRNNTGIIMQEHKRINTYFNTANKTSYTQMSDELKDYSSTWNNKFGSFCKENTHQQLSRYLQKKQLNWFFRRHRNKRVGWINNNYFNWRLHSKL